MAEILQDSETYLDLASEVSAPVGLAGLEPGGEARIGCYDGGGWNAGSAAAVGAAAGGTAVGAAAGVAAGAAAATAAVGAIYPALPAGCSHTPYAGCGASRFRRYCGANGHHCSVVAAP